MEAADEVVRTSGEMDTAMMPVLRAWCEEHAVGWAAQYTDDNPELACVCVRATSPVMCRRLANAKRVAASTATLGWAISSYTRRSRGSCEPQDYR